MSVKLSICIPTYNRAPMLSELLASIAVQVSERHHDLLEICISDNASNDGTDQMVESWRGRLPVSLVYHRNEENFGADRNYIQAVDLASGNFCWLFGSDDRVESGGLAHVFLQLERHPDNDLFVLTQNIYNFDFSVQEPAQFHPLLHHADNVFYASALDALKDAGYILGYLSVLLFRRTAWQGTTGYERCIGTAYVHTCRLLMMMRDGARVMYVRRPVLGYRGGNDSFLDDLKLLGRFEIDLEGYDRIPAFVFGEHSPEHRAMAHHGVNIFCFVHIRRMIFEHPSFKTLRTAFVLATKHYWLYPIYWLKIVPLFFIPASLVRKVKNFFLRVIDPLRKMVN